ncbi:MAG: phosphatidylglycerophosphatase A [Bdellovibrionales bacterium]|jgi:phosphatidylglycerophosphatase A|nr:phosphatidylglycerophosphatase A [Bdellovibrionales bacterium]
MTTHTTDNTAITTHKKFGLLPLPAGTSMRNPHVLIATWFGIGRLRPAPGTLGTLGAIPFGYAIAYYTGIAGLIVAALLMVWLGTIAATYYGKKSGKKDDQSIVVDEVAGMWIAAIPAATYPELWLLAFVLFRIFDIYKPWPASYFDKRPGGGGFDVMMDDVVAGIFAFFGVSAAALSASML